MASDWPHTRLRRLLGSSQSRSTSAGRVEARRRAIGWIRAVPLLASPAQPDLVAIRVRSPDQVDRIQRAIPFCTRAPRLRHVHQPGIIPNQHLLAPPLEAGPPSPVPLIEPHGASRLQPPQRLAEVDSPGLPQQVARCSVRTTA